MRFTSDTTDAEWRLLEPLLLSRPTRDRGPAGAPRDIVDAIFYVLRGAIMPSLNARMRSLSIIERSFD
jgi:transposase